MGRRVSIVSLISLLVLCSITSTRAKAKKTIAENGSSITSCAEEDNVNVCLRAKKVKKFRIIARHPAYAVGADSCAADFSGCLSTNGKGVGQEADSCQKLWDDGVTIIQVCAESNWWRPFDLSVRVNNSFASGHRLVLSKKIEGEPSWPQFMVLYEDGNMRLKAHPPLGQADVCFGSSVIVGPAAPGPRPFVDIQEINVDPLTLCADIVYRDGGTAKICFSVDRVQAVAEVKAGYDISNCFTVFRSMWVEDGNSDVDHVQAQDGGFPILAAWASLKGPSWFFHRIIRSKHNTSAPDTLIEALK